MPSFCSRSYQKQSESSRSQNVASKILKWTDKAWCKSTSARDGGKEKKIALIEQLGEEYNDLDKSHRVLSPMFFFMDPFLTTEIEFGDFTKILFVDRLHLCQEEVLTTLQKIKMGPSKSVLKSQYEAYMRNAKTITMTVYNCLDDPQRYCSCIFNNTLITVTLLHYCNE